MRHTRTFPRDVFRASANPVDAIGREARQTKIVAAAAAAIGAVCVAAAIFWIVASIPPALASVQDGAVDLSPRAPVAVSVWNLGGSIVKAEFTEAVRDIDGNLGPAHEIPVQLIPVPSGASTELRTEYRVERTDGAALMGFDGQYQLRLTASSAAAALFGEEVTAPSYTFSTLASPRLRLPEGVVPLDYQKPVELHWNHPIQSFSVETVPPLDVRTWIDPIRPDVSYVDLTGAKLATQYEVRVTKAAGAAGAEMVAPAQLRVLTPAPPELITDKVKMEDGYRVLVPWDRAIEDFDYEITPAVQSAAHVGVSDPWMGYILLLDPKQGQEYTVKIKGATATTGTPLSGARELKVATPKPLKVDKFVPQQSKYGVPLDAGIGITFSEPVKDRAAAEASISITPSVQGKFEWRAPNLVVFVPKGNLPGATNFEVQLAGGRGGVIGAGGGYLDQSQQFTFLTAQYKEIEVNLTEQELILWEGDQPIYSTLVSTGVRGAETPTGLFSVNYKMLDTRMRGVNPSGHSYDLPNVPWVMSFLGDYTLHGAYWRSTYGVEQSNGCVSMPVDVAKIVYDWTPEGTPVRIHY